MTGDKELAATYSRGSYTTTTIGNAVFDGRVRDGIGSGHCFMATNKIVKELIVKELSGFAGQGRHRLFSENHTQV